MLGGLLQVIRDVAEGEGNGQLQEETDGREGVGLEVLEAEGGDDAGGVGVEGALGAVVAEGDGEVDPHPPVGELRAQGWLASQTCSSDRAAWWGGDVRP